MENRIVFIDSHIANFQTLTAQLPHRTEAILLNAEHHGINQILMALRGRTNLSAIDIITHGSPGTITLGSGVLNNDNIDDFAQQLEQIGQHLEEDGDILLYGCEVAKGESGQVFIERIAQLTRAHLAASTNLTGSAELNGDWVLEAHMGKIQAEALQFSYEGVLAIIDGTPNDDTLTGTAEDDVLTGGAGNDLLIGGGGNDVANFLGNHDEYQLSTNEIGKITVRDMNTANGDEGTDTLDDAMVLRFADGDYVADVGNRGGEFRVNTTTDNSQATSAITTLNDGGFVVSWSSFNQDGSNNGIYAQRFNSDGTARGGEFQVNTTTTNSQTGSKIVTLADGGFVVSWESFGQDGSDYGIYAQRYNANGETVGGEFRINTTTAFEQWEHTVTTLADGGFVVSWESFNQDGSGYGIYAQRYNADSTVQGSEFRVNTTTANFQENPTITALADGGFVVSWMSFNQDAASTYGIYAQRYDVDGSPHGTEFRVNTTTVGDQWFPKIAALTSGGFVVSWESFNQDGSGFGIYAQRYDASGAVAGGEFKVNTTTISDQIGQKITALADGGFVVSWTSFNQDATSTYGIFAQRYTADGVAMGEEIQVNTTSNFDQFTGGITALGDGGFVISWQSSHPGGSDFNIYAQRYDAEGNQVQSVVQLSPLNTGSNQAPLLNTALIDQAVTFGNNLSYNLGSSFGDPNGDTLSYSATLTNGDPLPAWLHIDGVTGSISGMPTIDDRDTYSLIVKASDPEGLSATAPVTVAVTSFDAGKLLVSTAGNDTLSGTAANETVTYGHATAPVTVSLAIATQQNTLGAGLDTLTAINNLIGSDFNDNLTGNAQNNALEGGAGNDTLNGAGGADTMAGGSGNDTFVVNHSSDVVIEFLGEGIDKVNSNIAYILPSNLENLALTGTLAINGTGNDFNNVLTGNSADNELNGQAGNDTLNGGGGNDSLIGWSGADIMQGGTGNDTYFVENNGDLITELVNAGVDTVSSRLTYTLPNNVEDLILTGNAAINGTGNNLANVITGNSVANQLIGLTGNDTLNGNGGNDTLSGGAGNDLLTGGTGSDTLQGGQGDDAYVIENAGDVITELLNEGKDTVSTQLSYTLPTNVEHLTLTGTTAVNGIGNGLANTLTGNSAANQLNGLAGNDLLDGGAGTDILTGGVGNDIFRITTADSIDSITDFNVVNDTIQLENATLTVLSTGQLEPGQFRVGTQAQDANDYVIYNNATGALLYDADGNGTGIAVQIAALSTGLAMTATDIVVI